MPDLASRTFSAFNTVNTVSVEDGPHAQEALDAAEAACVRYERLFSHTLPGSDLVRVNEGAGTPVSVDPELAALARAALRYCDETGGLFDITAGPLVALWDLKRGIVPDDGSIAEALTHVDWHAVRVEGDTICVEDPLARVVLGGVAKGWIADGLLATLSQHGAKHAIVNLGGNVAVMGGRPQGGAWHVGVRVPLPSEQAGDKPFAYVEVADGSVVTSGVYERAATMADGSLAHHIIDLRTGKPAQSDLMSATLISPTSTDGDGYTTALIIMGLQAAMAFVEARPGLEAVFVTQKGNVHVTSGIIRGDVPFRVLV